jgi:hypothetical protein
MPIFHLKYPHFKHEENSLRGAIYADRHGYDKIDWDLQMTKDRVIVVTHWRRPMRRDGFRDPRHILDPDTPIGQLTWRQVKRLVTHDGYRIRRIEPMLRFAGRIGIRPVLEPKSKRFAVDWPWEHIAQVANEAGAHIEAYALRSHGGVETMAAAARHGVPARVINR